MSQQANFVIVKFTNENDAPGIVASKWITEDQTSCFYPNVRSDEMKEKLLKRMSSPNDMWPQYEIQVLKGYETYGEARLHLRRAEETSNLDSDEEIKQRKRKKKTVWLPNEPLTSSDDEFSSTNKTTEQRRYPVPPTKCLKTKETTIPNLQPQIPEVEVGDPLIVDDLIDIRPATSHDHTPSTVPSTNQIVNCPSGCLISKQFAVQQSHLIQMVTDLASQVTELNKKVDSLLGRSFDQLNGAKENIFDVPDFLTRLPVGDDFSFCQLNEQLIDNENKETMVKYLAGIGGRDARTLTTNMLRRILLDEVAEQYSLTGKQMKNSKKKCFVTTETCKLIFLICKKIHVGTTDEKLKEIISDWLNQAKVRINRRLERQKGPDKSTIVT